MAEEEIKTEATAATPAPEQPAAPVEEKKEGVKEIAADQMPTVVDDDVKQQGTGMLEAMISYLKRYNGYNVCSVCRIENIPEDTKEWSVLLSQLFMKYMMRPKKASNDEFKKAFAAKDMCYIQVHQVDQKEGGYPTVAADGCYNSVTINNKPIKSLTVGYFFLNNPDTFVPCMVVRTGPGKVGEPGTLGLIHGDPYHQISPEEATAIITQNMLPKEGEEAPAAPAAE